MCVCVCLPARMCAHTHTGPGWGWARLPGLVLPREDEKGEECELGAQSRDDTGEGAWLFPFVAALLDKLPWSLALREQDGEGGREEGLAPGGPWEGRGTLGKVGELAAGVCDRRGLGWGPCDQTAVTVFPCLFSLSLSVPVSYSFHLGLLADFPESTFPC